MHARFHAGEATGSNRFVGVLRGRKRIEAELRNGLASTPQASLPDEADDFIPLARGRALEQCASSPTFHIPQAVFGGKLASILAEDERPDIALQPVSEDP
jgi:hypothetical protein